MKTAARVSSDKLGLFYGDGGRKFAFDSIIVLIVVEQTLSSKMFVKIILYSTTGKHKHFLFLDICMNFDKICSHGIL